jgi:hypothetical protein
MFLIFLTTLANSLRDANPGIAGYLDLSYLNSTFQQLLPIAEVFGP